MWRVVLEPAAQGDLRQAAAWYGSQRTGLDDAFIAEVSRTLAGLQDEPWRFAVTALGLRRALVRRFPFAVYFRASEPSVHVLAVLHLHREVLQVLATRT